MSMSMSMSMSTSTSIGRKAPTTRMGRAAHLVAATTLGTALGLVSGACRLPNPEHCDNQDQAGNDYCAGRNSATPFCSPCHEKNQGCLPFEPLTCDGYQGGSDDGPGPGSSSSDDG